MQGTDSEGNDACTQITGLSLDIKVYPVGCIHILKYGRVSHVKSHKPKGSVRKVGYC